jgi:hypothetical protein
LTYKGFIKKSRTYDLAAIIAILAAIQPFIPQLDLSQNTITIIGMVIAGLVAYLRKVTTGPVGEK